MKVSGERTFDAPLAVVWSVLNDPARMAQTMPGVESFEIQDDRHWTANVKVPLGLGGAADDDRDSRRSRSASPSTRS